MVQSGHRTRKEVMTKFRALRNVGLNAKMDINGMSLNAHFILNAREM